LNLVAQIDRFLRKLGESSGGRLLEVEYELQAPDPIGVPPDDKPAWAWCHLKPAGNDFLASVENVVGGDPACKRLPDSAGTRRFELTGNGTSALLVEDTWRDADGWHYRFRLRDLPDEP
jgi:hypothetical protein